MYAPGSPLRVLSSEVLQVFFLPCEVDAPRRNRRVRTLWCRISHCSLRLLCHVPHRRYRMNLCKATTAPMATRANAISMSRVLRSFCWRVFTVQSYSVIWCPEHDLNLRPCGTS